ncbi:hypothetical protein D3C77_515950 [compost metagenome]
MIDHVAGGAPGLDGAGHALDEGANRPVARRDEAEDAGIAAAAAVARALQHDLAQFGHQQGIIACGLEEGFARQRQDVAVAQGHHVRHMRSARQQGQFADGIAGLDDGDHLRRAAVLLTEDAQSPGAQQVEGVGRIAGGEQSFAPRQGEPAGLGVLRAFEEPRQVSCEAVGGRRGHKAQISRIPRCAKPNPLPPGAEAS